ILHTQFQKFKRLYLKANHADETTGCGILAATPLMATCSTVTFDNFSRSLARASVPIAFSKALRASATFISYSADLLVIGTVADRFFLSRTYVVIVFCKS